MKTNIIIPASVMQGENELTITIKCDGAVENGKSSNEKSLLQTIVDSLRNSSRTKKMYYEIWIDLYEEFNEKIYPLVKDMPLCVAVEICEKYMINREIYYKSPMYIKHLNEALNEAFNEAD